MASNGHALSSSSDSGMGAVARAACQPYAPWLFCCLAPQHCVPAPAQLKPLQTAHKAPDATALRRVAPPAIMMTQR
jgi:hypothetical protein